MSDTPPPDELLAYEFADNMIAEVGRLNVRLTFAEWKSLRQTFHAAYLEIPAK